MPSIGILSLQGNYNTHGLCLNKLELDWRFINQPDQLKDIDGLIIPGGESSVLLKHFENNPRWIEAINHLYHQERPILATCAGIILLAQVVLPSQFSFSFLDISILRNAYGRQIKSRYKPVTFQLNSIETTDSVAFIRAPKIIEVSANVQVIARYRDEIVGVRQGNVFGLTCHPEYTTTYIHQNFYESVCHRAVVHK